MADKDAVAKEYMGDAAHFADAVNFYFFDGQQVVQPEHLKEMDPTMIALPHNEAGDKATVQRYRDLMKRITIMSDEHTVYLVMGIENQAEMHLAMVVRVMLEDAIQYAMQVQEIARMHKENGDKPDNSAEFLSGLHRGDKLKPVVTLTMYFGSQPWTAPTELHEMLDATPQILRFVDNYHLHLIDPYAITEDDLSKFRTELRLVLKCIKHSRSKKELNDALGSDEKFHDLSWETANMIDTMINANMKLPKEKRRVDMCDAIKQMVNDGKTEERTEIAKKLLSLGKLTNEEIAEASGLSLTEVQTLAGEKTA